MKLGKRLYAPLLGLTLALFNAALGTMLDSASVFYNTNLPFMSAMIYYFLNTCLTVLPGNRKLTFREYLLPSIAGVVDATATICVVYAYRYLSVAVVLLLISLSTPLSIVFYYIFMRQRVFVMEIVTVLFAFVFAGLFVCGDFKFDSAFNYQGILLSLATAVAYGLGGVLNEKFSTNMSSTKYLSRMSAMPFLISLTLFFSFEFEQMKQQDWRGITLSAAFSVCMVVFYFLTILLLKLANAVFFNTALILTNVFTFPVSILLFKQRFAWYQVVLAVLIVVSIICYIFVQSRRPSIEETSSGEVVTVYIGQ